MSQRNSRSSLTSGDSLVLVDEQGRVLGRETKEVCHQGQGLLHAAFLVMVFSENGSLLLARRSPSKPLWPCYWDGTVASHYLHDHDPLTRVKDKVYQEIRLKAEALEHVFRFLYQASYKEAGSEHELCDIYVFKGAAAAGLRPDPGEISQMRLTDLASLKSEIAADARQFTPWLLIALENLDRTLPPEPFRKP